MKILVIDTTGNDPYVALFQEESNISLLKLGQNSTTESLIKTIDALLKKTHLQMENITHFAVCTGPGSFTGTRIGVLTGKMFSFALKKPLIGFNAFIGKSPSISFIGKKRVAEWCSASSEITYREANQGESTDPVKFKLEDVYRYILKKIDSFGEKMGEKVEISYPNSI